MSTQEDQDDIFSAGEDEFGGFGANFGSESDGQGDVEAPTVTAEAKEEPPVVETTPEPAEDSEGVSDGKEDTDEPKAPVLKKRARMPLTKRQKAVRLMLRKAGLEELPELSVILRDKEGVEIAINELALFIDTPRDETLLELSDRVPGKNIVNLSAEVMKNRVITVGAEIIKAGRMFQPIQVADIMEDGVPTGNYQCTSGRHRLAFLALAYGATAKIPVYVENMTLNEARDAVVVANQARPTRARERAEHAVLGAVGGDADAEQDEMYNATATTKARSRKYCVYSVFQKNHPIPLGFPVSATSSRKDGGLTTVSNVENFWATSLTWDKDMKRKEFDGELAASILFLNQVAESMQVEEAFDSSHHLASMTLSAIGKWYRAYKEITGLDAAPKAAMVAKCIVSLGEIGRQKSDTTYSALTGLMRD
jgi:hypothetical protein